MAAERWCILQPAYAAPWKRATTAVGHASSSDPIVHFGLGRASMIQSIEIAWSSGIQQHPSNVPTDRYLTIHEPSH